MTNPNGGIPDYEGGALGGTLGAAGLLPGVGGVIDTFVSANTAKRNTDKTIEAQRREAELAYQRSIAMWHMQNEYNSPAEQMKRFGAAGLNPHLIYGQGSAGNANSTPQYQAPNIQYRYAAPAYGGAVSSIIPTLMSVGTWMQNMKASEVDIQAKQTGMEKTEQLIEFLRSRNPQLLQKGENELSIFPYQFDMQRWLASQASAKFQDFVRETEWKWDTKKPWEEKMMSIQQAAGSYKNKLLEAQSSWSDMDITNPQALMQMVLSGVMGMAGQQLRLSTHRGSKPMAGQKQRVGRTIETIDRKTGRKVKRWIYE